MNEVQFIIDFLSSPIFYGGSIFASFVWLLEHPDIYDRIKALFIKPFMSGRKKLQQHYLASDIQSKLNRFSRHVIKDLDEKERFKAKIQWVEDSTRDTFFNQDKIVIKMDCSDNSNRNLAIATLAYASEVVIRKCKPYLEPRLRNATNLIAAKKIIDGYAEEQEKNYYNNVFLFPTLEADTNLRDDCNYLSILDQNGYFTRLYLRELRYLGELLDGTIPTEDIQQETRNFFEYLSHIGCTPIIHVGGHYLNDNQFNLLGRYLKIRVLLLAITSNIENKNIKPYIKKIILLACHKGRGKIDRHWNH